MSFEELQEEKTMDVKLVMVGSQEVGKTSLALRYLRNCFSADVPTTIGASFFTSTIHALDYCLKLSIWDTAGQERFRCLAPIYYRDATAAFLLYDISCADSFVAMKDWAVELFKGTTNRDLLVFVVGNKLDQEANRQVATAEAKEYAKSIKAQYFETSAQNNEGIRSLFSQMALGSINCEENKLANEPAVKKQTVTLDEVVDRGDQTVRKKKCCS